jgi:ATP-dependent 26S proteasome regulatory subunit
MTCLEIADLESSFLKQCALSESEKARRIAGYDDVVQELREVLIWPHKYRDERSRLGIKWPRGCLLHGPPGVGKTRLVEVRISSASGDEIRYEN